MARFHFQKNATCPFTKSFQQLSLNNAVRHDVIANMALDRFSRESEMCKGTFDNKQEAEAWLDENA